MIWPWQYSRLLAGAQERADVWYHMAKRLEQKCAALKELEGQLLDKLLVQEQHHVQSIAEREHRIKDLEFDLYRSKLPITPVFPIPRCACGEPTAFARVEQDLNTWRCTKSWCACCYQREEGFQWKEKGVE